MLIEKYPFRFIKYLMNYRNSSFFLMDIPPCSICCEPRGLVSYETEPGRLVIHTNSLTSPLAGLGTYRKRDLTMTNK